MLNEAAQELIKSLNRVDRKAARRRVSLLRKRMPEASREELLRLLTQSKCLQAGAVGALVEATEFLPGVGRLAGSLLGPLADSAMVTMLQAELIIEVFAVYELDLPETGERFAILAIAAANTGTRQASNAVTRSLSRYASSLIGGFIFKRALPIARIATTATANIATTYAISQRAQTVARFGGARIEDWPQLMRQATRLDERTLVKWATSAARTAVDQVQDTAKSWIGRVTGMLPKLGTGSDTEAAARDLASLDEAVEQPKPRASKARARKAPASSKKPARKPRKS